MSSSSAPEYTVFICHAGEDKTTIAFPLRDMLKSEGITAFVDETDIKPGTDAPVAMTAAMETAHVAIIVLSPEFIARKWPMRELLCFLRRREKATAENPWPVIIPFFYRLDIPELYSEPRFDRVDGSGHKFVKGVILGKLPTTNAPTRDEIAKRDSFQKHFDAAYVTSRLSFDFDAKDNNGKASTQEGRVLELLLDESADKHREIVARGINGVRKTCLLRAISNLAPVKECFEDGIYYIILGVDATPGDLIESLSTVVQNSGGELEADAMRSESDVKKVMNRFRSWFEHKRCLFVVDDVWETNKFPSSTAHALIKLHTSGRGSKVLLATKSKEIAAEVDIHICLENRDPLEHESRAILLSYSGIEPKEGEQDVNNVVNEVLEQCGGLPLFLAVAGKSVKALSFRRGHKRCMAYYAYAKRLQSSRQSLLATGIGEYGNLSAQLTTSLELLEERKEDLEFLIDRSMGEIHRILSVMPKQGRAPMCMLKQLWKLANENQTLIVAGELEQVGLDIEYDETGPRGIEFLVLHESVYDFAEFETRKYKEEKVGHETLLRSYGEDFLAGKKCGEWWRTCLKPDGYIHENVCRHLLRAGHCSELVELLLKPQWAERQLNVNGIMFLSDDLSLGIEATRNGMEGYSEKECSETEEALQLISGALTLSSQALSKNNTELRFQLHGRLKRYGDRFRAIREYVDRIEMDAKRPRALCLNDFLEGPGGPNTKITSIRDPLYCMVMLDDGKRLACGCHLGDIVIADIHGSEIQKKRKAHDDHVWAIAVGNGGRRLVSGSKDGTSKVWDVATMRCVATFEGHTAAVMGVAILNDGKRAVSVSNDGTAQVWEMDTGRIVLPPFRGHEGHVYSVAVLKDKDEFITGGEDGKLILWSATTSARVGVPFEGHKAAVRSVTVTPNGGHIVSGSADHTLRMWDARSHKQIMDPFKKHSDTVRSVAVSRDGCRILSGSQDRTIRVWDSQSGKQVGAPLRGHGEVYGVSFLASFDSIVSCSFDGTARVWDAQRNQAGRATDGHESLVMCVKFTPKGNLVVSGSFDKTLRIWDPTTRRQVGDPLQGHSGRVYDVAITPNGRNIVSVSGDMTVGVWDLETRKLLHKLTGHTNEIWCVAVMPNGNHAVTGSLDRTVRIWDLSVMDGSHVVLEGHSTAVGRVFVTDDGL